jgi:hypothetical protein
MYSYYVRLCIPFLLYLLQHVVSFWQLSVVVELRAKPVSTN